MRIYVAERYVDVPAQAQVQGQLRSDLPVVLNEETVVPLTLSQLKRAGGSGEGGQAEEKVRQVETALLVGVSGVRAAVEEEGPRRADGYPSGGSTQIVLVHAPVLHLITELERVVAFVPERSVAQVGDQVVLDICRRPVTDTNLTAPCAVQEYFGTIGIRHPLNAKLLCDVLPKIRPLVPKVVLVEPDQKCVDHGGLDHPGVIKPQAIYCIEPGLAEFRSKSGVRAEAWLDAALVKT